MPIPGQEVSLDQAQASMPFKVQLPTNMGTPMQIKVLLPPQTDMPSVTIIYAAVKLPSNASIPDVLDQNGIGLGEMPIGMTLQEAAQTIRDAIDSTKNDVGGLQPVTINGYLGCEGGNIMHTVSWCTETTSYVLAANINYPLQQLVEIAQSIPIK